MAEERERARAVSSSSDPSSLTFTLRSFLPSPFVTHLPSLRLPSLRPRSWTGITSRVQRPCGLPMICFLQESVETNRYQVFSFFNGTFFFLLTPIANLLLTKSILHVYFFNLLHWRWSRLLKYLLFLCSGDDSSRRKVWYLKKKWNCQKKNTR